MDDTRKLRKLFALLVNQFLLEDEFNAWWQKLTARDKINHRASFLESAFSVDIGEFIQHNRDMNKIEDDNRRLSREWKAMEKQLEETKERLRIAERKAKIYYNGITNAMSTLETVDSRIASIRRNFFSLYDCDIKKPNHMSLDILMDILAAEESLEEVYTRQLHGAKCRIYNGEDKAKGTAEDIQDE